MILALTGLSAALATDIVSFWICISVALFDFFSPSVVFVDIGWFTCEPADAAAGDGVEEAEAEAEEDDDFAGTGVGSAEIRSISVLPDASYYNKKKFKGN